jgi:hypothetical protein
MERPGGRRKKTKVGLTDVGMVDLGEEPHFGRCHGVVFRQEQFQLEDSACNPGRARVIIESRPPARPVFRNIVTSAG